MSPSHVGAAVDIGSNSVHLLVARVRDGGLETLRDESVLIGLGDDLDRDGEISAAVAGTMLAALRDYAAVSSGMGAQQVTFIGTDPLRRAANGAEVASWVTDEIGLPLHVLSERQEGQLTYLGVTAGRQPAGSLLVVDIGGGSSEVVLATRGAPLQVISLATGSARLSREHVRSDPPTVDELDALLAAAHRLAEQLPAATPDEAVFVGGTATNLARLAPLRRDGLALAYRWLTSLDAESLSRRFRVNLRRARQLAAGAAIVDALIAHFALDGATPSEASLRDGAIYAAAELGAEWPELLGAHIDRSLLGAPVVTAKPATR